MGKLPRQAKDLTGKRYGKLIAVAFSHSDKGCWWKVKCDCGVERTVNGAALRRGGTRSCGCSHQDNAAAKASPDALWKRLRTGYRNNANQRGITWQIDDATFFRLIKLPCEYCGMEPANITHNGKNRQRTITHSGLDRIDNDQGYVDGNVVPCCSPCNMAKRSMTTDQFLSWALRLADFQRTK